MRKPLRALLAAAGAALLSLNAGAADPIRIAAIVELSGAGATSGTNFANGFEMAVKEINAAGGILGHPIEASAVDTQSNPGVAKGLATKAVDDGVFAVFGPVFSGSILVSMAETRRAEIPNFTGGEAALRIVPTVDLITSVVWQAANSKYRVPTTTASVWVFDIGLEKRFRDSIPHDAALVPFLGGGIGGRAYDFDSSDLVSRTCYAGYGAAVLFNRPINLFEIAQKVVRLLA